jgi:TPP-dependent pyruvate/acetoin dehydrogenase alpha subunit
MIDISIDAKNALRHALPASQQVDMLYKMRLVRAFEEAAEQQYFAGKVHGTMHLYIGEEATAVGAISASDACW